MRYNKNRYKTHKDIHYNSKKKKDLYLNLNHAIINFEWEVLPPSIHMLKFSLFFLIKFLKKRINKIKFKLELRLCFEPNNKMLKEKRNLKWGKKDLTQHNPT